MRELVLLWMKGSISAICSTCTSSRSSMMIFTDETTAMSEYMLSFSFEAEHLHLELDLLFVAIVRDADGGVDWAARLKE